MLLRELRDSQMTQFLQILSIQVKYITRDAPLLFTRFFTAVLFGVIIGILFYDLKNNQAGVQARIGLVFISLSYVGYSSMLVIPKMVALRTIHFREPVI